MSPPPTLKVVRLDPRAALPTYQTDGAAGLDLVALEAATIAAGGWAQVGTGIAVAVPEGHEAQVRPRSGLAVRHGVTVLNAPGTIDADYRGELKVALVNHGATAFEIQPGDRVAQLVVCPVTRVAVELVEALDPTPRGAGGFGSTGR
jgi:dUTP pyrophosphatase